MDSPKGEALLDVDEALRTLIDINNLENVLPREGSISPREIPPTPMLLLASRERSIVADEQEMDDDDIRTRRYWQKWGKRTARELIKLIEKEKIHGKRQKQRELTYSARMRGPHYYNESDTESEGTEISLLTCSSLARFQDTNAAKKSRRQKGSKGKEETKDQNQQKQPPTSSRTMGRMIEKLMSKDVSHLTAFVGGGIKDKREEEYEQAFNATERELLWKTGYTRGLHGKQKSESTGNIKEALPKKTIIKKAAPVLVTTTTGNSRHGATKVRAPSPKYIAVQVKSLHRPESIIGIDGHTYFEVKHQNSSIGGSINSASQVKSVFSTRHSAKADADTEVVKKYQRGLHGLPDFEGKFTKTVRQKIKRTVSAVRRKTGYGDDLNMVGIVPQEKGIYTSADYARIPKYPQQVLITPELSNVINVDIRSRMGRPRFHEIRRKDIRYFDSQNPPLDKANRNLIIFNWLLTNNEDDYEFSLEPEIFDLEGEERNKNYGEVLFHNDVMKRAATALSRVSTAFEDCSTLKTRSHSDFTGDVSGLDDQSGDNISSASFSDFSLDND